MPHAWRIVRSVRAAGAFSGEGARLGGGRWNSREVPVVYTSEHQSLAALELLVHINPRIQIELVVFRIEWENLAIEKVFLNQLPSNWRDQPPAGATVALGDQWVRRRKSVLLAVPSVLIPEESNYLINPLHPDFKHLEISPPKPFNLDQRLLA